MMTPARMHMIVVFVIMASASLVESCPISCILYPEICGEVGRCINGCCQYPNSRMNPNGQMSPNSGMNPYPIPYPYPKNPNSGMNPNGPPLNPNGQMSPNSGMNPTSEGCAVCGRPGECGTGGVCVGYCCQYPG